VRVMPLRVITKMLSSSIRRLLLESRQVIVDGGVSIESPFGNDVGKWNGGPSNVVGTINTSNGSF